MTDRKGLVCLLVGIGVAACSSSEAGIHVRATLDGVTIAGLEIQALPFDAQRILDSLAAVAPEPRPRDADLEADLMAFVPPDERALDEAGASWRVLRDSVRALADALHGMDRRAREYATLYEHFRGMYGRLAERTADRDRAFRQLSGRDRSLAERARAAAESLRAWERAAFATFDEVAGAAVLRSGREARSGTTTEEGELHLELPPGTWWLVARRTDPRNPFREFRWAREVVVTSWLPVHLPISAATAQRAWRH
jgi:hypothetical protein